MSKLPTGSDSHDSANSHGEVTGVFKSGEIPVHRLSEGANSAVSEVAVEREADPVLTNSSIDYESALTPISLGTTDETPVAKTVAEEKIETLEASVAKVDALVQSVEQRQSQIEEAHQKAEAMLEEVTRIAEALTFSNDLRDRISATVARTKRLRGGNIQ